MHFVDLIKRLTRIELLLFAACSGLLLGAGGPWYTLPASTLEAFECSLWLPHLMRLIPLLTAAVVAHMLWTGAQSSRRRLWIWTGLFASILFPFFVATFSPTVSFVASAFDLQREEVANHIETHFPNVQAQWKRSIHLNTREERKRHSPERTSTRQPFPWNTLPYVRPLVVDGEDFFQVTSWDWFVLEGLNYIPAFMDSAGKSWPITIAALVIALLATYLANPEALFADGHRMRPWLVSGLVVVLAMMLVPSLLARQVCTWQGAR